mmetsp:Transcript_9875/g.28025  ORF Transcript_9875/g.28025 Transcript_9875/m.28025 type:complete len:1289 (-) Transcript_9875:795-4661(-)
MFEKTLQDVVKGIRANKRDPKPFISLVIAECKKELKEMDVYVKAQAIRKLTFLHMLGYDMSWAAFQVIEVMSSPKFAYKRIGYLAACQSFQRDTEVLLLTTNHLKKEFSAANQYDIGQALNCLANIVNPDLARDLLPDTVNLVAHSKPYVRKKAVLVLYKLFVMYPQGLRLTFERLKERLGDAEQSVVSCAVNVICELANKNPKNYLNMAPQFFRLLTTTSNNWMLIKVVKLLGSLVPEEPRLARKLLEPLATIIQNTAAKSLQYECIYTVTLSLPYTKRSDGTESKNVPAVVKLCAENLRLFVEDPDQNLKYLGLVGFVQLMKSHPRAVVEHRELVLQCLNDEDVTIKTRALELLTGMVTKRNLEDLVHKLLRFVLLAEGPYRDELINKIIFMCSRDKYAFITDFAWYLSVLVDLATIQGSQHGKLVANQLMEVAMRVPPVRPYAVEAMVSFLLDAKLMLGQVQTTFNEVLYAAAWVVGEYAALLPEVIRDVQRKRRDEVEEDHVPRDTAVVHDDADDGDVLERGANGAIRFPPRNPYLAIVRALTHPRATNLPSTVQAVYMQNAMKVFVASVANADDGELAQILSLFSTRLNVFMQSTDVEVQERASSFTQLLVANQIMREHVPPPLVDASEPGADAGPKEPENGGKSGEETSASLLEDLISTTFDPTAAGASQPTRPVSLALDATSSTPEFIAAARNALPLLTCLFKEPLDPVNPRAQRKVPAPTNIDLFQPLQLAAIEHLYRSQEDGDHRPVASMHQVSFTEFKFVNDHDIAMDGFGSEFSGFGAGDPPLGGGAGGGGGGGGSGMDSLGGQGDAPTERTQIFSTYDQTDPFYIRSVNPDEVEVDDIPMLRLAPEDLEGPRGRRKRKKDKKRKVEYKVNVQDAMPHGLGASDEEDAPAGVAPVTRPSTRAGEPDLSAIDLSTPLREDETMPELKHREVVSRPPSTPEGATQIPDVAVAGRDSMEGRKSKKAKKAAKEAKKKSKKSGRGGGGGDGDLLDLMSFGSAPAAAGDGVPAKARGPVQSPVSKHSAAAAEGGAKAKGAKREIWCPIPLADNTPGAAGMVRLELKTSMSSSKERQMKISVRCANLSPGALSNVVFFLNGMPDGFRPVKAPAVAVSSSLAPGAAAEAILAVHTPKLPSAPILVNGYINFTGSADILLGLDTDAMQGTATFSTTLPHASLLSPSSISAADFASAVAQMGYRSSSKVQLRTPQVDPVATVAGFLHLRIVERESKKAASMFGKLPNGHMVAVLVKVREAHISVDIKSNSSQEVVDMLARDIKAAPV